jgi:hypothetical protein
VIDRRDGQRCGPHFAVRRDELVNRSERPAVEFSRNSVGTLEVRIHHPHEADCFPLLGKLVVYACVVASECANADNSRGYELLRQILLQGSDGDAQEYRIRPTNFKAKSPWKHLEF